MDQEKGPPTRADKLNRTKEEHGLSNAQVRLHRSIGRLHGERSRLRDEELAIPENVERMERLGLVLARARARASLRLRIGEVEERHKKVINALRSGALSSIVRSELQTGVERRRRWLSAAYAVAGWLKCKPAFGTHEPIAMKGSDSDTFFEAILDVLFTLPGADTILAATDLPYLGEDEDGGEEPDWTPAPDAIDDALPATTRLATRFDMATEGDEEEDWNGHPESSDTKLARGEEE